MDNNDIGRWRAKPGKALVVTHTTDSRNVWGKGQGFDGNTVGALLMSGEEGQGELHASITLTEAGQLDVLVQVDNMTVLSGQYRQTNEEVSGQADQRRYITGTETSLAVYKPRRTYLEEQGLRIIRQLADTLNARLELEEEGSLNVEGDYDFETALHLYTEAMSYLEDSSPEPEKEA